MVKRGGSKRKYAWKGMLVALVDHRVFDKGSQKIKGSGSRLRKWGWSCGKKSGPRLTLKKKTVKPWRKNADAPPGCQLGGWGPTNPRNKSRYARKQSVVGRKMLGT